MEHLWAPWRNLYVKDSQKHEGNIFAEIARGTDDEGHYVLTRGKSSFAILNVYPYNTGHLMIIPYRATGALEDLGDDELLEMMTMLKRMKAAVTAAFQPHGFNVGINLGKVAGAGILEHLHIHIVPRWSGDTNFMPVLAGTGVIPEAMKEIAAKLRAELAK